MKSRAPVAKFADRLLPNATLAKPAETQQAAPMQSLDSPTHEIPCSCPGCFAIRDW